MTTKEIQRAQEMRDRGMSVVVIAKTFGVTPNTIRNHTERTEEWRKLDNIQVYHAYKLRQRGMTWAYLAHKFNCSPQLIRARVVKKFGDPKGDT